MTIKFNATFTETIFTAATKAIISTVDADDLYTEIARIPVTDLGDLSGPESDQDEIVDGLNDQIRQLTAERGLQVTGSDGDGENLFWTTAPMLPIDAAAANHQSAVKAEAATRAELYSALKEQVRQGMTRSEVARRAGITRVTVDRVLRMPSA